MLDADSACAMLLELPDSLLARILALAARADDAGEAGKAGACPLPPMCCWKLEAEVCASELERPAHAAFNKLAVLRAVCRQFRRVVEGEAAPWECLRVDVAREMSADLAPQLEDLQLPEDRRAAVVAERAGEPGRGVRALAASGRLGWVSSLRLKLPYAVIARGTSWPAGLCELGERMPEAPLRALAEAEALRSSLRELDLEFGVLDFDAQSRSDLPSTYKIVRVRDYPFSCLHLLAPFLALRSLRLGSPKQVYCTYSGCAPAAFESLCGLPHLTALDLSDLRLSTALLRALGGLRERLHALSVLADAMDGQLELYEFAAGFTRLERLAVRLDNASLVAADLFGPVDLAPLARLTALRSLSLNGRRFTSLDFLAPLTRLEHLALCPREAHDLSPLLAHAARLRSLHVDVLGREGAPGHTSFPSSASPPSSCPPCLPLCSPPDAAQGLTLRCEGAYIESLCQLPLGGWSRLRLLQLQCGPLRESYPALAPLLERLAADVPSLRDLEVWSPLPLPFPADVTAALRGRLVRLAALAPPREEAGGEERLRELEAALGIPVERLSQD